MICLRWNSSEWSVYTIRTLVLLYVGCKTNIFFLHANINILLKSELFLPVYITIHIVTICKYISHVNNPTLDSINSQGYKLATFLEQVNNLWLADWIKE